MQLNSLGDILEIVIDITLHWNGGMFLLDIGEIWSDIGGEVCHLVAKCPNLIDLKLSNCEDVDDVVSQLCLGDKNQNHICHKLKKLSLDNTSVTCKGLSVILEKLKGLEYLSHEKLGEGLWEIYSQQQPEVLHKFLLKLNNISFDTSESKESSLVPMVRYLHSCAVLCPNLTKLHCPVSEHHLTSLVLAKNLKEVTFHATIKESVGVFRRELSLLLKHIGVSITDISLYGAPVPFSTFCVNCPNITSITLSQRSRKVSWRNSLFKPRKSISPVLKKLGFLMLSGYSVDLGILSACCPNLEKLWILFDSLFKPKSAASVLGDSTPQPHLPKLKELNIRLYVYAGNELQSSALSYLLQDALNLQKLELEGILPKVYPWFLNYTRLPSLTRLSLCFCIYRNLSESCLMGLLGHAPNVAHISLSYMAVTDAVFHRLMGMNNLSCLLHARFRACSISTETVKMLLLATPEGLYREVECTKCHPVAGSDQQDIESMIHSNGWEVIRKRFL